MENYEKMPTFCCNGEELTLDQIKNRKVISVTVAYLSELKKVKVSLIKELFGKENFVQEKKELVVTDEQGVIIFHELGDPFASISFQKEEEWEKTIDYDRDTLFKRYLATVDHPFQINFHIANLRSISWI